MTTVCLTVFLKICVWKAGVTIYKINTTTTAASGNNNDNNNNGTDVSSQTNFPYYYCDIPVGICPVSVSNTTLRYSVVSIVTTLGLDGSGFEFRQVQRIFLFQKCRPALGPAQARVQCVPAALVPGCRAAGPWRETRCWFRMQSGDLCWESTGIRWKSCLVYERLVICTLYIFPFAGRFRFRIEGNRCILS